MRFNNDQWTIIDYLGFEPAGDQLARLILLADPPFAVGVNGKWGSGKTSLMRYAMARLGGHMVQSTLPGQPGSDLAELSGDESEKWSALARDIKVKEFIEENAPDKYNFKGENIPIRSVWFNPWQYQNEPSPLIPLLHEIRAQFSTWLKAQDEINRALRVSAEAGLELLSNLADSALALAKLPSGFKGIVGKIRSIGERLEKANLEVATDAQRFNLLFERAVSLLLGIEPGSQSTGRLVIFIDDLDRCEQGKLVNLLEAIKLYLSTDYCVFVLGHDRTAVEKAVKRVLELSSLREAREYVEKLFQATVGVPVCHDYAPFINGLLKDTDFTGAEQKVAKVLCDLLEPNPRKVKNFVNSLVTARHMLTGSSVDPIRFALFHYMRCFHCDVYRLIEQDPAKFRSLWNAIAGKANKSDQAEQFFRKRFLHVLRIRPESESKEHADEARTEMVDAVDRFEQLLDQQKGDRAFVEYLGASFNREDAEAIADIRKLCCAASMVPPAAHEVSP